MFKLEHKTTVGVRKDFNINMFRVGQPQKLCFNLFKAFIHMKDFYFENPAEETIIQERKNFLTIKVV